MPRERQRACLQDGLKLDINRLLKQGIVRPGSLNLSFVEWPSNYLRDTISAELFSDTGDTITGSMRIKMSNGIDQTVHMVSQPRRFGGRQWYFSCPRTGRRVSVLYRLHGADRFASRHAWGTRRVAYRSQFNDPYGRAHAGKERIKSRLIADLARDEWDLPPKPKWMRWKTYNRLEARFDGYESTLDVGIYRAAQRLGLLDAD